MTIAVCAALFSIVGSIVPGLPGPPVGWLGLLVAYIWGGEHFARGDISTTALIVMFVFMVVVSIMDYYLPVALTRVMGGSKYSSRGAMAGLIAGCVVGFVNFWLGVLAMIALPFFGAWIFEMIWGHKSAGPAAKGGLGAFLGLLSGTGVKLIYSFALFFVMF